MYSLRYGTIPIVRHTGGLADSVRHFDPATGEGTGCVFNDYDAPAVRWALNTTLDWFEDRQSWRRLMQNAMREDFSWGRQILMYEKVFRDVRAVLDRGRLSAPLPAARSGGHSAAHSDARCAFATPRSMPGAPADRALASVFRPIADACAERAELRRLPGSCTTTNASGARASCSCKRSIDARSIGPRYEFDRRCAHTCR